LPPPPFGHQRAEGAGIWCKIVYKYLIYNSEVYIKLMDKETGLYIESSAYVYELLKEEYRMGKLATNGG